MADMGLGAIQAQQQPDDDQELMDFYRYGLPGMDHTDPAQAQAMMQRFPGMEERNKKYTLTDEKEKEIVRRSSMAMLQAIQTGDNNMIFKAIDDNAIVIMATGDPGITPEVMKAIAHENPMLFYEMIKGAFMATGGEIDEG